MVGIVSGGGLQQVAVVGAVAFQGHKPADAIFPENSSAVGLGQIDKAAVLDFLIQLGDTVRGDRTHLDLGGLVT